MKWKEVFRTGAALAAPVAFACSLFGCSVLDEPETPQQGAAKTETVASAKSDSEKRDTSSAWYNLPVFEPVFGDFGPASGDTPRDRAVLESMLQQGEHLAKAVAACGSCHGMERGNPSSPLAGGLELRDDNGTVIAPNITSDKDTGIGRWSVPEIVRAIRSSIDKEGRPLSIELHQNYRWMSNEDATAIALYLRTTRPVKNSVERRELGALARNKYLVIPKYSEILGYVPRYQPSVSPGYGWYLTSVVANCASCHSAGGSLVPSEPILGGSTRGHSTSGLSDLILGTSETKQDGIEDLPAGGPNIRGSEGLKDWAEQDIVKYLQTGKTKDGATSNGKLCPWPYYKGMNETEMRAIAYFLKRL